MIALPAVIAEPCPVLPCLAGPAKTRLAKPGPITPSLACREKPRPAKPRHTVPGRALPCRTQAQ